MAARDLPLAAGDLQRFVGLYSLSSPPDTSQMPLRVFVRDGVLMGQFRANDPTRLLNQGGGTFRPAAASEFELSFSPSGQLAMRVEVRGPGGVMRGDRANVSSDPSTSGALYDALARMDSLMFDATFVRCDLAAVNALFTEDAEFYHDKTGLQAGAQVRANNARLTANCPASKGVTRQLVPGSLHVYPLADFGAVQTGNHRFVERGASSSTEARFVHVWRKTAGGWQISRALSFDHQPVDPR